VDFRPLEQFTGLDQPIELVRSDEEIVTPIDFSGPWIPGRRGHAEHQVG
jgi:hypothetical protein